MLAQPQVLSGSELRVCTPLCLPGACLSTTTKAGVWMTQTHGATQLPGQTARGWTVGWGPMNKSLMVPASSLCLRYLLFRAMTMLAVMVHGQPTPTLGRTILVPLWDKPTTLGSTIDSTQQIFHLMTPRTSLTGARLPCPVWGCWTVSRILSRVPGPPLALLAVATTPATVTLRC